MKLMAVSDLHGNLDGLDPSGCDVVAVAGDFSKMYGFGYWHVYSQTGWIKKKFFDFVSSYPDVQFVVTPGNHDLSFDPRYNSNDWRADLQDCPQNLRFLVDSGAEILGLKFWGTPWVPPISGVWAFEADDKKQKLAFSLIPNGVDVLISHSPPRIPDRELDVSDFGTTKSRPFGSWMLADAVSEKKPRYMFCGHIHTGDHAPAEFAGSTVYNVSRLNESYEIRYEPLILDVQPATEDNI